MNEPFYEFELYDDALMFMFESVGSRGEISKVVKYKETSKENLYALVLADIMPDGRLNYLSRSNNDDREKILATVFQTLTPFFAYYPESTVIFTGSTPSRTRLYQIAISNQLKNVSHTFNILGLNDGKLETFDKNKSYEAFLISKKIN